MTARTGYVILSGPPASGKSTLGPVLARELGWAYLAKDTIKLALIDRLGAPDVAESRRLGEAAMAALLAIAVETSAAVLDGSWLRHRTARMLEQLASPVVEVFCRCPQDLLESRYEDRAVTRGAGHFDRERSWQELWGEQTSEPVAAGWPVIEVNTVGAVDVVSLAAAVVNAISGVDQVRNASAVTQPDYPAIPNRRS